nr:MAG TPA: hypothetical protein [Bacteriophage sp.]
MKIGSHTKKQHYERRNKKLLSYICMCNNYLNNPLYC